MHAIALAIRAVAEAFRRHWPQTRLMDMMDDSLSADLERAGAIDGALIRRFADLARYAELARGADCEEHRLQRRHQIDPSRALLSVREHRVP